MKIKLVFIFLLFVLSGNCFAQYRIACTKYDNYILTHTLTQAGPIPTAFDTNGVYPYISYSATSNRPVLKKYKFIILKIPYLPIPLQPGEDRLARYGAYREYE
jgi:hypothetical protein